MFAMLRARKMLVAIVVGTVAGVALTLGVVTGVAGKAPVSAGASGLTPTAAEASHGDAGGAPGGPTYLVKDRIVNLADASGKRFLRYSVAVAFASGAGASKDGGHGGSAKDADKEFQAAIKPYGPAIEDAISAVLSSKTADDMRSPDGKEAAKRDIAQRVKQIVGKTQTVSSVYLTDLVVQ